MLVLSVTSMNIGDIMITTEDLPEGGIGSFSPAFSNIGVTYSKEFSNSIYGGLAMRVIGESISNVRASGVCFDAGIRLAPENIRVNAVCPGFVYTALTENVTDTPEVHETMKALHPMGRLAQPVEIANVVAFLASAAADYITGQVIHVNGGMYM